MGVMVSGQRRINYDLQTLRGDLFGGITSTIVALPVALAFGMASGLGAAAGMYSAIAMGFFATVFGGTRCQISGPTGPMVIAMAVIISTHTSSLTEALTIVVLAGLIQVLVGLLGIGRFIVYTPYMVVSGFMSGIGIIIMTMHTLPFVGAQTVQGGVMGTLRAWPDVIADINTSALAIASVTLAVCVFWPRWLKAYLPAPLAALIVGTLSGMLWFNDVPVIGSMPGGFPEMHLGLPSAGFLLQALHPALILALLGAIDSLLTSLVADALTGKQHNPNRELVGQGLGNMVSGLFGGAPGAGSTTGTVTNIRAGGVTRMSGVMYALLILAVALGLGRYIEPIPVAVLAGILMKVGWDIVDWRVIARAHRINRADVIVTLVTLGLTVFVDLITGVAIGLIVAGMAHARQLESLELDSTLSVPLMDRTFFSGLKGMAEVDPYSARVGLVALKGSFTVASSRKLTEVIGADIKEHEIVIFDFSGTTYLDDSAAMVVENLMNIATEEHTEFIVMGLSVTVAHTLHTLNILQRVPQERLVETLEEAREVAYELIVQQELESK